MQFESDKLGSAAVIFVIMYTLMPFVARFVGTYMTTYAYMLFLVLFLALILVGKKMTSVNKYFFNVSPFLIYGFFSHLVDKSESLVLWGYNFLIFVMPIIIGTYVLEQHKKDCKKYSIFITVCLLITCITTIRGLNLYPEAARWLATASDIDKELIYKYAWMNIGGYDMVYIMVLMYPMLVLAFKKKKIGLFKTIAISVLLFVCLVYADYTTALILFVGTTVMFFMKRKLRFSDIVVFFGAVVFFMVLFSGVTSKILMSIAQNIKSDNVSERLMSLAGGHTAMFGAEDKRIEFYMSSINSFLKHPLGAFFGGENTGGHSFILDVIGKYGIFGIMVLYLMYRKLYVLFYAKYSKKEDFGYIMWIFVQAFTLSAINTGMWVDVLAFYVPVMLYVLYEGEENEESSVDSQHTSESGE